MTWSVRLLLAGWLLGSAALLHAQTEKVTLYADLSPGDLSQVKVQLQVEGNLKLLAKDDPKELPMKLQADLHYQERLLKGSPMVPVGLRSLRQYEQAKASIEVAGGKHTRQLGVERRLIVADAHEEGLDHFSPNGPLRRDDLDVLEVQGDTLLLHGLLPTEPVAEGDTWETPPDLWARVLNVDAVSESTVESKITQLTETAAIWESSGKLAAAVDGVTTEIQLRTKALFDRKRGRITQFALAMRETRSISHVSPGLDVMAQLQVQIEPLKNSEPLSDPVVKAVPTKPTPEKLQLVHHLPGTGFFLYDRDWLILDESSHKVVLRWLHRGTLMAQCNVAVGKPLEAGQFLSAEHFQEGLRESLGENFEKFEEVNQVASEQGYRIDRVVVRGSASELPIRWHYFLIADDQGRQVIFTFTFEDGLLESFADRDWKIANSFRFIAPEKK